MGRSPRPLVKQQPTRAMGEASPKPPVKQPTRAMGETSPKQPVKQPTRATLAPADLVSLDDPVDKGPSKFDMHLDSMVEEVTTYVAEIINKSKPVLDCDDPLPSSRRSSRDRPSEKGAARKAHERPKLLLTDHRYDASIYEPQLRRLHFMNRTPDIHFSTPPVVDDFVAKSLSARDFPPSCTALLGPMSTTTPRDVREDLRHFHAIWQREEAERQRQQHEPQARRESATAETPPPPAAAPSAGAASDSAPADPETPLAVLRHQAFSKHYRDSFAAVATRHAVAEEKARADRLSLWLAELDVWEPKPPPVAPPPVPPSPRPPQPPLRAKPLAPLRPELPIGWDVPDLVDDGIDEYEKRQERTRNTALRALDALRPHGGRLRATGLKYDPRLRALYSSARCAVDRCVAPSAWSSVPLSLSPKVAPCRLHTRIDSLPEQARRRAQPLHHARGARGGGPRRREGDTQSQGACSSHVELHTLARLRLHFWRPTVRCTTILLASKPSHLAARRTACPQGLLTTVRGAAARQVVARWSLAVSMWKERASRSDSKDWCAARGAGSYIPPPFVYPTIYPSPWRHPSLVLSPSCRSAVTSRSTPYAANSPLPPNLQVRHQRGKGPNARAALGASTADGRGPTCPVRSTHRQSRVSTLPTSSSPAAIQSLASLSI